MGAADLPWQHFSNSNCCCAVSGMESMGQHHTCGTGCPSAVSIGGVVRHACLLPPLDLHPPVPPVIYDTCTICCMTLYRRGYRSDSAVHKAALNEAAAAGLLLLAGWPEVAHQPGQAGSTTGARSAIAAPCCRNGAPTA
jgi:hypothetical protein